MTREEAVQAIYKIIGTGILDMTIEEELTEVADCIEADGFDD